MEGLRLAPRAVPHSWSAAYQGDERLDVGTPEAPSASMVYSVIGRFQQMYEEGEYTRSAV